MLMAYFTTIGRDTIFPIPSHKRGRGIASTFAYSHENQGQNVSPFSFPPPSIINISINRTVTMNNLLRRNSFLSAL